jgi:hypothetical protein
MTARHRAEPQYDPTLAPGVNNRAPELLVIEAWDGSDIFMCPHCSTEDPDLREVLAARVLRKAVVFDGGYIFRGITAALGEERERYVTGHAESLPII